MATVESGVEIAAPVGAVWAVLTDLNAYADWNPFVSRARGELDPGSRLELRLEPGGGDPATIRPRVEAVEPGRRLEWSWGSRIPGLDDRRHRLLVQEGERGTLLVQQVSADGPLARFQFDDAAFRRGIEAMNAACKERVERLHEETGEE